MADPITDVKNDLGGKIADLRAGRLQFNGATLWLMVLIALGAFLAYTLLIRKKPAASTDATAQPTSGQQPAAFISEPLSIVNEAPPATVITGTTQTPPGGTVWGHPPITGHPVPPTPTTTPNARKTYQVQSGDTLSTIAAREHVSLAALEATPGNWTTIRNTEQAHGHTTFTWDLIFPGETLYLPN